MGVSEKATRMARMLWVTWEASGARGMLVPGMTAGAHFRSLEKPSWGPRVPFFMGTGGTASAAWAERTPKTSPGGAAKTTARTKETKRSARNRTLRVYPRAPGTVNAMRYRAGVAGYRP